MEENTNFSLAKTFSGQFFVSFAFCVQWRVKSNILPGTDFSDGIVFDSFLPPSMVCYLDCFFHVFFCRFMCARYSR